MSDQQKAFLAIFLGSVIGGATAAVSKIGLLEFPPLTFAFLRFFISSLIILPFLIRLKKNIKKDFINLFPVSLFASINIVFFILGLKFTTATISQLLYAGVPLLTGLIAFVFLSQKLSNRKIFGIIVGFIGVLSVVLLPVIEQGKAFSGDLLGNLLISIGVICFSFYMVFSKEAQKKYSPFEVTSTFILLTTIILFPFFIFDLKANYGWWISVDIKGIISIVYIAIVATIFTYILNQYAIKHGGSVFASMTYYLLPVFGFLFSFFLLGERLTEGIVIGGGLALLGIFLTTMPYKKNKL